MSPTPNPGQPGVTYRPFTHEDLDRIGEIDRTERISGRYIQHGANLVFEPGDFSAPAWLTEGDGDYSVAHQRAECEHYLATGGVGLGAFSGTRLVGVGIVRAGIRPGIAQLAYLHVSNGFRAKGIGNHLARELERIALGHGDTAMVVSATPSQNTVDFYRHFGFEPDADPVPELLELEPEDIHMRKRLGPA